jgi:hypothetical protein
MSRSAAPLRQLRRAALLVAGVAVLALAAWGAARAGAARAAIGDGAIAPSVIYPPQRLPLVFSHATHATTACLTCHVTARTSQSATDRMIPAEAVCAGCHPIDRAAPTRVVAGQPPATCVTCHPTWTAGQPVERVEILTPHLKFSHAAHAATACASCHGDVAAVTSSSRAMLPTMATCLGCHDAETSDGADPACGTCHLQNVGGVLRTELPDGQLLPTPSSSASADDAHDADFLRRHGAVASTVGATCGACHDQAMCTDCHLGQTSERVFHAPGYERSHAAEARRGTPDCAVCHRAQTFCAGCHDRLGVGTRPPSEFVAGDALRAFHPAGWASTSIADPNLHAAEARRNLPSCTSCHREDDCLTCHSAQPGIVRVSPHPPGFRGSAACRAMDKANRRMCLRCHITEDELGCDFFGLEPTP